MRDMLSLASMNVNFELNERVRKSTQLGGRNTMHSDFDYWNTICETSHTFI
jgi:hypothetical protein